MALCIYPQGHQSDENSHQSRQAVSLHQQKKKRKKNVEMFFNRECPEVSDEECLVIVCGAHGDEIFVHPQRGKPVTPQGGGNKSAGHEESDQREIDPCGRLDTKNASDVKLLDVEEPAQALFFKDARRDQNTADRE